MGNCRSVESGASENFVNFRGNAFIVCALSSGISSPLAGEEQGGGGSMWHEQTRAFSTETALDSSPHPDLPPQGGKEKSVTLLPQGGGRGEGILSFPHKGIRINLSDDFPLKPSSFPPRPPRRGTRGGRLGWGVFSGDDPPTFLLPHKSPTEGDKGGGVPNAFGPNMF